MHSRQNGFTPAGGQAAAGSLSAAGILVSECSVEAELRAFRTNETPPALLLALLSDISLATAADMAPLAATAAALSMLCDDVMDLWTNCLQMVCHKCAFDWSKLKAGASSFQPMLEAD
ncbi:MAG: hypothetical protein FRX49_01165 [Trebouxia sp. A1-2]|nr:MAG: hypothetical protein FRX49_01165 [Trebouxia sp. A1-2]